MNGFWQRACLHIIVPEITTTMPRGIAKSNLPQKTCAHCGRPFSWRKKWEKVWDEVRYCSEACRSAPRPSQPPPSR